MERDGPISAAAILEQSAGLRRLARALVAGGPEVDDLVQETWEVALEERGRRGPLAPWLKGVLRNRVRARARSEARRLRREAAVTGEDIQVPSPETIVGTLEAHELVTRLVAGLEPDVREALFLRYYEGLSSTEIGRRLSVPPGTVRWRIKTGISELRTRLDGAFGNRRSWALLLLPGVPLPTAPAGLALGVIGMKKALAIVSILILITVGAWLRFGGEAPNAPRGDQQASASAASARLERGADEEPLPAWFGAPDRQARRIAGRVVYQGDPVANARVVLTSNATRTGLREPQVIITDVSGAFDFGEHRPALYDVSASKDALGMGFVRSNTLDATADPQGEALVIQLSGCESVVYGQVRDVSGGAIVGANLRPAQGGYRDSWPTGLGVVTDSVGSYALCTPAGPVQIVVQAEGYGSLTLLESVFGRRRLDAELVPEAVVEGRVLRESDDAAIAGALVTLTPADFPDRVRTSNAVAVTDRNGGFRIVGVTPGRHQLRAEAAEALGWMSIVLEAGHGAEPVLLRVAEPIRRVSGLLVDEAGDPVAGALVAATLQGKRAEAWPPTGADGIFEFRLHQRGPLHLSVDGYQVLSPASPTDSVGEALVVRVRAHGSLEGVVLSATGVTRDAVVTIEGRTLAWPRDVRTDDKGRFRIRGLPHGSYKITARSYGEQSKGSLSVELASQQHLDGVIVQLRAQASISGRVLSANGDGAVGVSVRYTDPKTGDTCEATSSDEGAFVCAMLAGGGRYTPTVRPDPASAIQLAPARGHDFSDLALGLGEQADGHVLRVDLERDFIRGQVVTSSGAPVPDAVVRAIESSTGYTPETAPWTNTRRSVSDADGRFRIPVLSAASYIIHVRAPGGGEGVREGIVASDAAIQVRISQPGRLVGVLEGFQSRPEVFVRPTGNTVDFLWPTIVDGGFELGGLEPGPYAVSAIRGSEGDSATVEIAAGETATITLRPREKVHLRGTVQDFLTGEPVQGAQCTVYPYEPGGGIYGWGTAVPIPTNTAGEFALELPSGLLEVTCFPQHGLHGEGAARIHARPGSESHIAIPVVVAQETTRGIGARFHLSHDEAGGGYIHTVVELRTGSAAEAAGLLVGDHVIAVAGHDVSPLVGLDSLIGLHEVGTKIRLQVLRAGTPLAITVMMEMGRE